MDELGFEASVTQKIIEAETNDGRFESLCRAVIGHLEGGARILPTSVTWDRGRDGVGLGNATGIIVCASLRDDVDEKALSDIKRVSETTSNVKLLYFCSSQRLTEHRKDRIERALADEFEEFGFQVRCLGSIQMTPLARQEATVLNRLYGSEIRDCIRAITADPSDETEVRGLRLALLTAGSDDSRVIRESVYEGSILEVFLDKVPHSVATCSRLLAGLLKLQRNIDESALMPHIDHLVSAGLLKKENHVYVITEEGLLHRQREALEAADRFVAGKSAIKSQLEAAIGSKIQIDDFSRIWSVFEERLAAYFQSRGDAIVREMGAMLAIEVPDANGASPSETRTSLSFLDELADAVATTSSHPQRQAELAQAIKDMFADRSSEAARWLVQICASFVAACALGLEYSSGVAISSLLARTAIVLDTDVVLSLIGVGEPEHAAADLLIRKWAQNGGKVLVADPVLQETAYHAFIASRDFEQVRNFIPGTAEERLHLIENAFVRSFAELVSRGEARVADWRNYIKQFKGSSPYEYNTVYGYLSTEHSVRRLPQRPTAFASLADGVRRYLLELAETKLRVQSHEMKKVRDKASRDGELYSSLVAYVENLKETDPGATCLLVSSARRLTDVDANFQRSGERQLVVSLAAATYLVSLLPNVSLGLSAMKSFLFDENRVRFSSDLERTLVRMVRSSKEVSMPFAKRGILMRAMRERLVNDAIARGERNAERRVRDLEKEALKPANQDRTIELLTKSLDAIAVDSRLERENQDLRKRLATLEEQLSRRDRGRKN